MKSIRINRLCLENFKCHRLLELDLRGRSASVYGDNAAGKTSICDALTWLLFGKDSKGNGEKNIDLKPLGPDGQVADHQAITAVEAELDVDGQITTLRRTLREVWSAKRGSGQETFDGNTSEYFVDGVPQKKYGYDAKIREIVPEDVFRLLTSVSYFARDMGWQDRRAALFGIAAPAPDTEIMATDARFAPLAAAAGDPCRWQTISASCRRTAKSLWARKRMLRRGYPSSRRWPSSAGRWTAAACRWSWKS